MTQYNNLHVKLSNLKLNNLKSGLYHTKVTLEISLNVVGDANDVKNFHHKLLLTNTQVSRVGKAFANNLSPNVNVLKPAAKSVLISLRLTAAASTADTMFGSGVTTLIISNEW